MRNRHLSVSQVKKYMSSPSSWAWAYLLWIWDEFKSDAMVIGSAFHLSIETQNVKEWFNYLEENAKKVDDMETAVEVVNTLWDNYLELNPIKATIHEQPFDKDLWYWINFKGFIDWIVDDTILEYKSAAKLSNKDDAPMTRQAHNNREEYHFQVWLYMRATWLRKAKLIEVVKKDTTIKRIGKLSKSALIKLCNNFDKEDKALTIQSIINKYKPKRQSWQVIDIVRTDERDKDMDKKYGNVIREMMSLYNKHKK